jgi:hypothetical protein
MTNPNPATTSSAPGPRDTTRDRGSDSARADRAATGHQVRLLEQLALAGMGLARATGARVTEPAGTEQNIGDQAIAFGHVARAIRQTIGLEIKLRAERRAREPDPAAAAATERQLRLLKELAEIGLAVAGAPVNLGAVPMFLKVASAVRRTVGLAVGLRNGRPAPVQGAAAAPPQPSGAEPAANPGSDESPEEPVEGIGDIATTLAETLDAFNEYYRFLKVPVAEAVARIFETLGVPVETGRPPAETGAEAAPATDPVPAPAAPAATDDGPGSANDRERMQARLDFLLSQRPGAGNRGPP